MLGGHAQSGSAAHLNEAAILEDLRRWYSPRYSFRQAREIGKLAAELRVGRSSDPERRNLQHLSKLGLPWLTVVYRTPCIDEADRIEREVLAFLRETTRKVINHALDHGGNGPYSGSLQAVYIAWRPKNAYLRR